MGSLPDESGRAHPPARARRALPAGEGLARRAFLRSIVGLAALGLSAACGGAGLELPRIALRTPPPEAEDRRPGVTVCALAGEVGTLDPANALTPAAEAVCGALFERLVSLGPRAEPRPALAERWSLSRDGLAYTFQLRPRVTLHDGTPFDASVARYSLERLLGDERPARRGLLFGIVRSVRAVDAGTLELRLDRPFSPLLHHLAQVGAAIVSPAAHRQGERRFSEQPVGSGPFHFVERAGSRIVLERWEGSWRGAPRLSRVVFRTGQEEKARLALLREGSVQVASPLSPDASTEVARDEALQLELAPSARVIGIAINTQAPPFDDRRVRQALNYAVDKEALARSVFSERATVLGGPLSPAVQGAFPLSPYPYDPDRARALLVEAGLAGGLEAPLLATDGRFPGDAALGRAIQQQLHAVRVKARLEIADQPGYVSAITKAPDGTALRLTLVSWLPTTGEPRDALYPLFHSSQWMPRGYNASFVKDAYLDELLEQGTRATAASSQERAFWQAQELLREEAPWVFLLSPAAVVPRSPRLHEPVVTATEVVTVSERTWLDEEPASAEAEES